MRDITMDDNENSNDTEVNFPLLTVKTEVNHSYSDANQDNDDNPPLIEYESMKPTDAADTVTEPKNDADPQSNGTVKHQSSPPNDKLLVLRTSVEDKSHLLSSAWNDLYNLLGEYKAELFSKEVMAQKYEGISDIDQLRKELLQKEHEILEKDSEMNDMRGQLDEIHRHNEQCQMDLSVKDSLLKKYQEDLLQKEAALMTSNTKISRLENRLRMLESKVNAQSSLGEVGPPRKIMRTPMTPGRVMSNMGGRFNPAMPNRISSAVTPGRPVPGNIGRLTPGASGRFMPGSNLARRRPFIPPPQVQRRTIASTITSPATKTPIVCIEVDDDDEIKEISDATTSIANDMQTIQNSGAGNSLYMGAWPEQADDGSSETDTTGLHSLPGSSMDQQPYPISTSLTSAADMNQPLMMSDSHQAGFSGQDDSMEGGWPLEMSAMGDMNTRGQGQNQSPSNKFACPHCGRCFSLKNNRDRHIRVVHMDLKKYTCPVCGHRFAQRGHLDGHMHSAHKRGQESFRMQSP